MSSFSVVGGPSAFGGGASSVQGAGTATAPAAGSAFATVAAASIPAGTYYLTAAFLISGAVDASRPDNVRILNGAVGILDLPTGSSQNVLITGVMPRVVVDGVNTVKIVVLSNASAGAIYTGGIQMTRIA